MRPPCWISRWLNSSSWLRTISSSNRPMRVKTSRCQQPNGMFCTRRGSVTPIRKYALPTPKGCAIAAALAHPFGVGTAYFQARLRDADPEVRVADAEGMGERGRDGARDRRVVRGERGDDATDVIRGGFSERGDEAGDVVRRVHGVRVHADDDVASRHANRGVQACRRDLLRVVEQADRRMLDGIARDDVAALVAAHPVRDEHLEALLRVVAPENRLETRADIGLLV